MSERRPGVSRQSAELGLRGHPLVQLTLVRVREFVREPEAVFWAVFFPVLLATGLGVAFRGGSNEILAIVTSSPSLAGSLRQDPGLHVQELDAARAAEALRNGQVALFVEPGPNGVIYHYDDTNPQARTARLLADTAIQRSAGRADPVPHCRRSCARAGCALHRLPGSGSRRTRHHEQCRVGPRLLDC